MSIEPKQMSDERLANRLKNLRIDGHSYVSNELASHIEWQRARLAEAEQQRDIYACELNNSKMDAARLAEAEQGKDGAYRERNQVVAALARMAVLLGWNAGTAKTAIDGRDPAWHGCVYIDLPTGQASWHFHDREAHLFSGLPAYVKPWDGHSTEEKYARLARIDTLLGESGGREAIPSEALPLTESEREWAKGVAARVGPAESYRSPDGSLDSKVRNGPCPWCGNKSHHNFTKHPPEHTRDCGATGKDGAR